MRSRLIRALLPVLLAGLFAVDGAAQTVTVRLGSSREEVLAALGEPQGTLKKGDGEMLVFAAGDVVLENGRVVKVSEALRDPRDVAAAAEAGAGVAGDEALAGEEGFAAGAANAAVDLKHQMATAFRRGLSRSPDEADGAEVKVQFGVLAIFGVVVVVVGGLVSAGAGLWFLVKAFQEHIGWGLACLFLPFAALVFLIVHWRVAMKPFLLNLAGTGVMIGGMVLMFVGMGG